MRKSLVLLLGSVLSLALIPGAWGQFTAFNDHNTGAGTHPNATTWNVFTNINGALGYWGPLKDIYSGSSLPVYLVITNINVRSGNTSGAPAPGTPADQVFAGYIDWGTGSQDALQMSDPQSPTPLTPRCVVGYVFTNLNVTHRYKFTGTAVRNGGYSDRWTVFELSGAQSFTNAHTANVLLGTSPGLTTNDIALNQCVINTGINVAGDYAAWDNISPGTNGSFAVLCWTYRGTIPTGSSAGDYAYGITGLKLEDITAAPVSIVIQPQPAIVNEGQSATFSVVCEGSQPTYQWYRIQAGVTNPIAAAINTAYTLTNARPADNAAQFFVVAQNTVTGQVYTATSSIALLTVNADTNPPVLLSAFASFTLTNVTLGFSEAISAGTATNLENYAITNATGQPVTILSAAQTSLSNVVLTTVLLTNGATYVVIVNGLTDTSAAANQIAPNSTMSFVTQSSFTGVSLGGATPGATWTQVPDGVDVTGGGADLGGTSDSCQFIYQTRTGNFDVRVRIASMSLSDQWVEVGLMARPTASAANSPFAAALASPGMSGCYFMSRATVGAAAATVGSFPVNYPYTWLRLQRNGNSYIGYASIDGTTWALLGSNAISMGDPVTLGFVVTSRANGVTNRVQFRDFSDTVNPTSLGSVSLPVEPLGPSSRQTGFVISEIMYHPGAIPGVSNSLEFIEIFNSEPVPASLTGHRLSGSIHYSFPTNTIMPPGGFLVVARDPAFFQSYYGLTGVLGPWYGNADYELSNNLTNNNLPGDKGTVRLRNRLNAVLLEVNYEGENPWPIAADGAGHSLILARPSFGERDLRAWAASDTMGGSPGRFDPVSFDNLRNIVINEFLANSHTDPPLEDYIELYNHGNNTVNLGGAWLTDTSNTNKFRIPNGTTIGPRGFVLYNRTNLPFGLNTEGGRIYLVNSNATKVIDVVKYEAQSAGVPLGRYPDGAPGFRELSARTPGTNNAPLLLRDIVINEIMYNPLTGGKDNQYVELYNKGTNPVDLLGWKFRDGINFTFTNSMIIAPNGYVVVARNTGMLKFNHGLTDAVVAGNFDGNLAGGGERIALYMPEELVTTNKDNQPVTNTIYILENEVTYGDGGRWGDWSDGGGSSLELVDARSDNRQAANWADSDETTKATWQSFSITITNAINTGMPSSYSPDNLHIYLLDVGECLVDDVKVLTSGNSNLLGDAQGRFDAGVVLSNASLALLNANGGAFPGYFNTNWVAQGGFDQSLIDATGGPDNSRCLHLRAGIHGDPGPNKIRSPFFSVNASGIMTLQASAKWLRGWPEIILRTHGGGYEIVQNLQPPANLGTPGAPNSRAATNAGPALWDVVHAPVLPAANQAVVVTARAFDPDGIGSLSLLYRIDPNVNFLSLPMLDDGTGDDAVAGDGLYSATIPGQTDSTIISFYLAAVDSLGATNLFPQNVFPPAGLDRCFPNDSFSRECLIRWGDFNMPGSFATYHMWMTTNTVRRWLDREPRSNGSLDLTFAYNNSRVVYNGAVKSAGSAFHRGAQTAGPVASTRVDYDVSFPSDDSILGENGMSIVVPGNVSGNDCTDKTALAEKMCLIAADETMVCNAHRRFVHAFVNGSQRSRVSSRTGHFLEEDAARANRAFLRAWYADDYEDGDLIKLDDWFEFNDASTGFQNFNATFTRRSVFMSGQGELLSTNKYRFQWQIRSELGGSLNNWSNFMALVNAFSPTLNDYAPVNLAALEAHVDMQQWAREIAMRHAVGDFDAWGYDRGKNNYIFKPSKGRYEFVPFDVDWSMAQSSRSATDPIFKCGRDNDTASGSVTFNSGDERGVAMYTNPAIRRIFLGAYEALINGPFQNSYLDPIIDQWTAVFTQNNIDYDSAAVGNMKSFILARRNFILTYLSGATGPFSVSTPSSLSTGTNWVTLSGYAPVSIKTIKINGIDYPITWTTVNAWSISLFLNEPVNTLRIQPYDRYDNLLTNIICTVSYTNPIPALPGMIVFNELLYNPAVSNAAFLEIVNTSTNFTFDISGWHINGLGNYTFPGGSSITNRQHLILAKDRAVFAATYGTTIPVFDVFDGNLDLDGETLTLYRPAATTNDTDLVIDKVRYEAAAPWPALAPGSSIQLVDTDEDNARVGNWSSGAQWRFFSSTGNPGTNAILYIYSTNREIDLFLDDVRLVLGTNAGAGTNLLRNGGFESGTTTNWMLKSPLSSVSSSVHYSGDHSLRLLELNNSGPLFSGLSQAATNGFVANTNYTLSYWYLPNFRGSNLMTQMGLTIARFKTTNSNVTAVRSTPAARNSLADNLPPFPLLWLNEVQARNMSTRSNRFGQFTPWVELYNAETNALDLSGYFLANNYTSNKTQWIFPTNTLINPGEFKVIWLDAAESNSIPEELHAGFTIPQATGSVGLFRFVQVGTNTQLQAVDYLNYSGLGANLSYGAYPDGQPFKRQIFFRVTPGGTNDAQPGILKINEWLALNVSSSTNNLPGYPNPSGGGYDDWFEIYNPNPFDVNLDGYYLTDNTNQTQYRIPAGYYVPANGFLMVWADNNPGRNTNTHPDLHVSFNLGRDGDQIALSDVNLNLLDSVSFGPQLENLSQGRFADGGGNESGPFFFMAKPTPGSNNIWFVNSAPSLASVSDQIVTNGRILYVTNVAADVDPWQNLAYHLGPNPLPGTTINSSSGLFTWRVPLPQAPGVYTNTIWVEDNGYPRLCATNKFVVHVVTTNNPNINTPPFLDPIQDQNINLGQTISFTVSATDTDQPPQLLTFTLDPGAPSTATITTVNGTNGVFSWTPTAAGTNDITVRVTDNGLPQLSATRSFTARIVQSVPRPALSIVQQENTVEVAWPANSAGYILQCAGSLGVTPAANWTNYIGPAITNIDVISVNFFISTNQYFRLVKP